MDKKLKLISLKTRLLSIALVGSTLSSYNDYVNSLIPSNDYKYIIETNNDDNLFDFSYFININENLSEDEKNLFLAVLNELESHVEYMDRAMVNERLANLKINYMNNDFDNPKVGGSYSHTNNTIIMPTCGFSDTNKYHLIHEFLHVFQNNSSDFTLELSNECLTREVVLNLINDGAIDKIKFNGYRRYVNYYLIISKLVSKETLIKYQYTSDINLIKDELLLIVDNKEYIDQLFDEIDNLRIYDKEVNAYVAVPIDDDYVYNNKVFKLLNNIYYAKHNKFIEEDEEVSMLAPSNDINVRSGDNNKFFENYIIDDVCNKTKIYNRKD